MALGLWYLTLLMSTMDTLDQQMRNIDEHNGYLRLTDEEYTQAVDRVDGLQKEACTFIEYGKVLNMRKSMKDIGQGQSS